MSSARALKPALSLRPSTANRPGMHSRGSSQGSMRSLSRSHTPTPSPSAAAAEARCYFSIPSSSAATNMNIDVGIGGGGGGTKTATPAPGGPHSSAHFAPADTACESPKRIGRSRPIAIDLGGSRKSRGPTDTPPEPLSARGDFHGGYFPLHENVNRSYTPHPFASTPSVTESSASANHPYDFYATSSDQFKKPEASGAVPSEKILSNTKIYPQQRGAPDSLTPSFFGTHTSYTPYGHCIIDSPSASNRPSGNTTAPSKPKLKPQDSFQFTSCPPLRPPPNTRNSAYLSPGGMGMAQGKYHPSHYKAPNMTSNQTSPSKKANMGLASGSPILQPMGPLSGGQGADSIKKKLLQYQQDMREQAAMAARLQVPVRQPRSPKLLPLGSPGPVTPWELDGEANGYPGFGRAAAGLGVEKM